MFATLHCDLFRSSHSKDRDCAFFPESPALDIELMLEYLLEQKANLVKDKLFPCKVCRRVEGGMEPENKCGFLISLLPAGGEMCL